MMASSSGDTQFIGRPNGGAVRQGVTAPFVVTMIAVWDALFIEESLEAGRTRPLVLSCESRTPGAPERGVFVVKAPGLPEVDGIFCCRELMGHMIARAVGLRTPEPAIIEISDDFVNVTRRELAALGLSISSGPAFGCRRLVSLANVTRSTTNAPERLSEAARIYAVDMMLQNHLFWDALRRQPIDWSGTLDAIETLDDARLQAIGEAIPRGWACGERRDRVFTHIRAIRDNIDRFHEELKASFV